LTGLKNVVPRKNLWLITVNVTKRWPAKIALIIQQIKKQIKTKDGGDMI
jgi:hypothetical protein